MEPPDAFDLEAMAARIRREDAGRPVAYDMALAHPSDPRPEWLPSRIHLCINPAVPEGRVILVDSQMIDPGPSEGSEEPRPKVLPRGRAVLLLVR